MNWRIWNISYFFEFCDWIYLHNIQTFFNVALFLQSMYCFCYSNKPNQEKRILQKIEAKSNHKTNKLTLSFVFSSVQKRTGKNRSLKVKTGNYKSRQVGTGKDRSDHKALYTLSDFVRLCLTFFDFVKLCLTFLRFVWLC